VHVYTVPTFVWKCTHYSYIHLATLLTNYRCHDTILRLPSNLFFESTLQARSTSQLHPSCVSALEFVCTSMDDTRLHNCPDFDDREVKILLQQVLMYVHKFTSVFVVTCVQYMFYVCRVHLIVLHGIGKPSS